MHDVLRSRLIRRIESLPEEQVYQVLDFIEFLEVKYGSAQPAPATGLQSFGERLEDRLRKRALSPSSLREAFQLLSAADRVLSGVSDAGKRILAELQELPDAPSGEPRVRTAEGPEEVELPGLTPDSRTG